MENNPFNPVCTVLAVVTVRLLDIGGRAERKPMLSLELERGLFKLRADGPELEVLLNADPRIGNHRNFVIISQCIFISVFGFH